MKNTLLFVLLALFQTINLNAKIIYGTKVVQLGQPIDIGITKIPWSKANKQYGYIYHIDDLTFANIQEGFWTGLSYLTYSGVNNIADVSDISIFSFNLASDFGNNNYDFIAFADSLSTNNHYNGILLFKYKNYYGGIEFVNIENDYSLHYNYWYDEEGIGDFSSLGDFESYTVANFQLDGLYRDQKLNLFFKWEYADFRNFDVKGFKIFMNNNVLCETNDSLAREILCSLEDAPEIMRFTAKAFDYIGNESPSSNYILLNKKDSYPKAVINVNTYSGQVPLKVTFDASNSTYPNNELTFYDWSFGDGSTGYGEVVDYTYTKPGIYTVMLSVYYDEFNAVDTTLEINVVNEINY